MATHDVFTPDQAEELVRLLELRELTAAERAPTLRELGQMRDYARSLGADVREGRRLALARLERASAAADSLVAALNELKPRVRSIDAPREPLAHGLGQTEVAIAMESTPVGLEGLHTIETQVAAAAVMLRMAAAEAARRASRPRQGGRPSNELYQSEVICDLADMYMSRTGRRPTSTKTGDFVLLCQIVCGVDHLPKNAVAAALRSRKPPPKL